MGDRAPPRSSTAAKLSKLKTQRQAQPHAAKVLDVANTELPAAGGRRGQQGRGEGALKEALGEKDEIINSLRSRLSIAQQQQQRLGQHAVVVQPAAAQAEAPPGASAVSALEAQNAQLEGANLQLRQRLQDALLELQQAHDQMHILQQLQQELEEGVPGAAALVAAAVAQERAQQDARNERVLHMLRSKDEVIQSFEARYAEAQSEAVSYKAQLDSALAALDNSQLRVGELVDARAKLRTQLQASEAAAEQAAAAAKAEATQLQEEVGTLRQRDAERCSLHDRIIAQQADLAAAHSEVQKLSEAVEAANVVIEELQAVVQQREEQLGQHEQEMQHLEQHVASLTGLAPADGSLPVASAGAQLPPAEYTQRIAELEAANERLEQALVRASGHGPESAEQLGRHGSNAEDDEAITQLTVQLAEREGQLHAAQQQVAQLEALQHLARETALQTEHKLKESVRQAAAYQQDCARAQQHAEQADAVAAQLNARVSELVLSDQATRSELLSVNQELERVRLESREAEQRSQVQTESLRAAHAEELGRAQNAVASAETRLAASKAEAATLREQVVDLQQQLEVQQRQQQLGRSGRDSSLGRSVFLSSIQEAGKAASSQLASGSVPISWEDAAALPHDKLLQLVHALQLDLKAAQAEADGARAATATAQQRALAAERQAHVKGQQSGALLESIAASMSQMRQSTQAGVVLEGDLKAAQLRQQHAEEALHAVQAEAARLKVQLTERCIALQRQVGLAEEQCRRVLAEKAASQEACRAAEQAAEERRAQLAVVMETLEVLQAGSADGQQEHLLSMTAELTAARAQEAALHTRCRHLEQQLEDAQAQAASSQQRLDAALELAKVVQQRQTEEAAAAEVSRAEVEDLRAKLLEQRELAAKASAELSEVRQAAAASKAAAAGMQAALRQAQERHQEQLSRERAEASVALQKAQLARLQSSLQLPPQQLPLGELELAPLWDAMAQLKAAVADGKEGVPAKLVDSFTSKVQELLLQAQHTDAEMKTLAAELQTAREQCRSAEMALEARTSKWQAAQAEKEALQHQAAQLETVSASRTAQQLRLLQQRNSTLCEQLQHSRVQLAQMEATVQQAESERSRCRAEASNLLGKLGGLESELASQTAGSRSNTLDLSGVRALLQALATAPDRDPAPSQHLQALQRQLEQQAQQLAALHESLEQREAQLLARSSELQNAQCAVALLEAQLKDARQRASTAEQRTREELAGSSLQECEAVARQAALVKEQAEQAAKLAQQKALQEIQAAQCRVEELEAQLLSEQHGKDTMVASIAQLETQLAKTSAALDAKSAALALLQGRAMEARPAGSPGAKQQPPGVASLSQHLLDASLQAVEANKQLAVAEKQNKSLQRQLAYSERRAAQLKEALSAKVAAHKALLEQLQQGPLSVESSPAGLPGLFSAEPSRTEVGAQAAMPAPAPAASPGAELVPPGPDAACLQLELAKREADIERLQVALGKAMDAQRGQAECFASLTAQAQHIEQELRSRLATLSEASSELAQLRAKCYAVVHELQTAMADAPAAPSADILGPEHLPELARELLSQLQEQRQVIERLQQYATAAAANQASSAERSRAAEEPLAPLECSQRSVIRSLTVQLADLRRQLAHLTTDRDQLQERLRTLRGSLGTGRAAETLIDLQDAADPGAMQWEGLGAMPGRPRSSISLPVSPEEVSLEHAAGMFTLLRLHIKALARAQDQLTALVQQPAAAAQQQPQSGEGGERQTCGSPTVTEVAHAAAMLAAELPAVQATIQVLEAEVTLLLSQQRVQGPPGAAEAPPAALPMPLPPLHGDASGEAPPPAEAAPEQGLASKLLKARQRRDKWKARCLELEEELDALRATAEQAEALAQDRINAAECTQQELAEQHGLLAAELQAAQESVLAVEADKAELQGALECCTRQLTEAASLADMLRQQLQAQEQQQQEAEGQLREQVEEAQGQLSKERQEHAQLVTSLQSMIMGLQSAGGTEANLRSQLIQLAEQVAMLTAAQEAARVEVEQKESTLVELQQELSRLQAANNALEAERSCAEEALAAMRQQYSVLQELLESTELRLRQVEGSLAARCEALEAALEDSSCRPDPPGVQALLAGLGSLQAAAEDLQDQFGRLEAQAAVLIQQKHAAAVAQWARLARSQRYRTAVETLRDGLQLDLLEAQSLCRQQAAQLSQLQEAAAASQQECQQLLQRLEEAHAFHDNELQRLAERHAQEMAGMEQAIHVAQQELGRQAELQVQAATEAAEQRAKAELAERVSEVQQRALQDVTNAESQRSQLQRELAAARTEFKRYQALKAVEVKLLEQRLLQHMRGATTAGATGGSKGGGASVGTSVALPSSRSGRGQQQPADPAALLAQAGSPSLQQEPLLEAAVDARPGSITAVSEIQAVCGSDGVAAALREANLERMQREQVEQEAAALREAAEQLRARLKAAEGELAGLKGRVGAEAKAAKDKAQALQAELAECQQSLRVAKADSSRRLRELQALQKQVSAEEGGEGGRGVPEAALDRERQARESAESQLKEAKQALARKTSLVKELRNKVSELEQELVVNSPAPLQLELDASLARVKQLQASCASKESTIRELRQRLEERVRLAAEQGAQEERQRCRGALQELQAELARREGQVTSLQEELQQVHQELAAATASMQSAVQERQDALEGRELQLVRSMQHAQQLSQLAQELLAMLGVLGGAVSSGAATCAAHAAAANAAAAAAGQQGPVVPGANGIAQQLACCVDLPADDIQALLEDGPSPSAAGAAAGQYPAGGIGSGGDSSVLPGLLQEAGQVVEQLRAALSAGVPGDAALLAVLGDLLAAVKQQCFRACNALQSAVAQVGQQPAAMEVIGGKAGPSSSSPSREVVDISNLEEQLRQAARAVAEIEGRFQLC